MKILIIGPKLPYYFETACAQGFAKLGCEVLQVDNKPPRWWLGKSSWYSLPYPLQKAQDLAASTEVYLTAKRWRPEIIFFCKAENIRAEILTLLKRELKCKIAAWYADNPFNAAVSSYQSLRHIQKTDYCFIWAHYLVDTLMSGGCKRAFFLPFAFNPDLYPSSLELSHRDMMEYGCDVSFVGTWDPERETHLSRLVNKGFDLKIFGQGWKRVGKNSPCKPFVCQDALWLTEVVKVCKASKICLNFLKRHNWKGHNFRTMEVAGIGGGALVTPWTVDQASLLFKDKEEIFCFAGDYPEPSWIQALLQNRNYTKAVALAAQKRVFREHLLHFRLKEILEIISKD